MMPLVLTMGDPAGVGGEIAAKAWAALADTGPHFAIIADPFWIAAMTCRSTSSVRSTRSATCSPARCPCCRSTCRKSPVPASRTRRMRLPSIASIERAVHLAMAGEASAVVTNPISKAVLYQAGFPHPGHTEFLGALTGGTPVMMLAAPALRVVLVTIHVSLRQALDLVTTPRHRRRRAQHACRPAPGFRHRRAPFGRRRAQPACRREWRDGHGGADDHCPGDRAAPRGRHRRHRAVPAGHDVLGRGPARPMTRRSACTTTRGSSPSRHWT